MESALTNRNIRFNPRIKRMYIQFISGGISIWNLITTHIPINFSYRICLKMLEWTKKMYLIFFEIIFVNRKQKLSYLCIIVIHLATKIRDIKLVKFLMAIKHNNKMNFFLHQSSFSKLSSRETNFEAFLHNSSEKLRRFRFMFTLS